MAVYAVCHTNGVWGGDRVSTTDPAYSLPPNHQLIQMGGPLPPLDQYYKIAADGASYVAATSQEITDAGADHPALAAALAAARQSFLVQVLIVAQLAEPAALLPYDRLIWRYCQMVKAAAALGG